MAQVVIKYGTERHKKIVEAVRARKNFSRKKMEQYLSRWSDADELFRAYIPEGEIDRKRKDKRKLGLPDYVTVEVPYSYAVMMTAHTYWTSVFLGRNPIFQLMARHGEGQNKVQAMESLLDYQIAQGLMLPAFYNWLYEMPKYSIGILGLYWDEEFRVVSRIEEVQVEAEGIEIEGKLRKKKITEQIPGYKGNKVFNIRGADYYPDPRVPISETQKGEFVGRDVRAGWNTILRGEATGRFYNIEALRKKLGSGERNKSDSGSSLQEWPETGEAGFEALDEKIEYADLHEMTIELVPKKWGLGSGSYPEKWIFTLGENEVLIGCRPMGMAHDRFPFFVQEFGFGTDEFIKWSLLDSIKPLAHTISWLFNSHFYNVRAALNNTYIVDPSRVVMRDVDDPAPGGRIRLKPEFYGSDVREVITQLQTQDVTQTHLRDSQYVEQMTQRVSGVVDNLMGMLDQGGRKTATEVRTSSGYSTNRLKTISEYNSALAWAPLSQMMVQNIQQFYEGEQIFRVAGSRLGTDLMTEKVTPELISGFYDYVMVDGNLPVDRLAQANMWKELFTQIARTPQVLMQFDIVEMIIHTMSLMGERNVDRFRIQLTPDNALQQGAQAGNVIPLGGPKGAGTTKGGPAPSGAGNTSGVSRT